MTWLEEVQLYLLEQITDRYRARHLGIKTLKELEGISPSQVESYVGLAHEVISSACGQTLKDNPDSGYSCKLTLASSTIGRKILSTFRVTEDRKDTKTYLMIGDLMIEALFNCELVDIDIPEVPEGSRTWTPPVTVTPTEAWPVDVPECSSKYSIRGSFFKRPGDITQHFQRIPIDGTGLVSFVKVIKNWSEDNGLDFRKVARTPSLKAVSKLQQTGWVINKDVLRVVADKPEAFFKEDSKEKKQISQEIEYKYILAKANAFEDREFFMAADMDYRGRIYFKESFLNFQGSDLAKGLLTFSVAKEVTPEGLRWLKIHTASSYNESYNINRIPEWCTSDYKTYLQSEGLEDISVDKMTLRDRELWCDNNEGLINETVKNGTIHECEKPVNFLAAAIELSSYWDCDGTFYSSLPIPVDGSNNGWQHLGAISKDTQTGKLVGLEPVGIQNDFYVQCAKKLIELTNDERRSDILSNMPMKHIRKFIAKRGSMTRAYSAGMGKIRDNMYADCRKGNAHRTYGITLEDCEGFAKDLIKAIEKTCPGPLKTMKFLQKLAGELIEGKAEAITWETPAGFPVIYKKGYLKKMKVKGTIRGYGKKKGTRGRVNHVLQFESDILDPRKVACGVSPNFIHSNDAAHMQLIINEFDGSFGAIHDSFSTHASQVDELIMKTKEIFVDMYSVDNYFNLIEKKLGVTYTQPPLGDLDVADVFFSDYFFA